MERRVGETVHVVCVMRRGEGEGEREMGSIIHVARD